ncbi:hypothetical protein [Photobacterium kagoshimensis]|uniref:hypothetical protein n=1 Tax=Photobacterium kagoshimensis TaxID=2910242 RepID=UPI003D115DAC
MSFIRISNKVLTALAVPSYRQFNGEMMTLEPAGFVARLIKETPTADELEKLGLRVRVTKIGKACLTIESVVPVDLSVEYQLSLFKLGYIDGMVTDFLQNQSGLYSYLFKTNKILDERQLRHFY